MIAPVVAGSEEHAVQIGAEGWVDMAQHARKRVLLVGDDLYATDRDLIREGAAHGYTNAVLI